MAFQNLHFISGLLCNLMLFNIFCFRITGGLIGGNKPQALDMRGLLHDENDGDEDLQDNITDDDCNDGEGDDDAMVALRQLCTAKAVI